MGFFNFNDVSIAWMKCQAYKRQRFFEIYNNKNKTNYNQKTMVTANKRSVMVLGSLGTGKSTFLNTLSGEDLAEDEPFESAM